MESMSHDKDMAALFNASKNLAHLGCCGWSFANDSFLLGYILLGYRKAGCSFKAFLLGINKIEPRPLVGSMRHAHRNSKRK